MSEHDDQAAVIAWASAMQFLHPELCLLFAIPNGARMTWKLDEKGRRYSPGAQRAKQEGLRPGVPDLCLPIPRRGFHGLFIEMKHGRNKPSDVQATFLDALADQGYLAVVCWGPQDAIETIQDYLS